MISAVFVNRPRLAIVIAIVMTLAGLISLTRLPVAQFPDIVPPQVQVTTTYPGASAAVVESTVAQPLEAAINGVDRMLYMKSNSANDGSYSLTVSFALGTDPDIDTVNVNNRVQATLARLPSDVQHQGVTTQKRSSAILEFLQFYSEGGKQSPLFISNYVTINALDRLARVPGVGQAFVFGALNYSMRIWFDTDRLISLNLAPSDIITAIQAQNTQAAVGRVGARPTASDTEFQINLQTQGRLTTPEQFANIVIRANPDGSVLRVRDVARVELGAANEDTESRLNGNPAVTIGMYLAPGANAVATSARVSQTLADLSTRFPEGLKTIVFYDSSTFVSDTIDEVIKTLGEAFVLVVVVVFLFLGNFRATTHPDHRRAGQPDRHLRRAARRRLLGQHGLAARPGAGDRHRGRRRDRGGRERRARDGGGARAHAAGGHQEGHGADHRADHRDLARAALGVRADRVHPRHLRPALPPVRGHHQRRHDHLGDQRADAVAGALRRVPAAAYRAAARHHGPRDARDRPCARRLCGAGAAPHPARGHRRPAGRGVRRRHGRPVAGARPPASCRRRTRARSSSPCNCRTAPP